MSDQDFFFDDEEQEESKKEDSKKTGQKKSQSKQSSQAKGSAKTQPRTVNRKSSSPTKAKPARPKASAASAQKRASAPAGGAMTVTVPITALIAVVTLLLGVIVGFVIAPRNPAGTSTVDQSSGASNMGSSMESSGTAPELSEEQMMQGMPAGHPNVGSSSDTSSTK